MEPARRVVEARTAQGSLFEALFLRAFPAEGLYAAELRHAGFDPTHPEAAYTPSVWAACVRIARQHAFPALPDEQAYRALGGPFAEAFLQTIAGRIVAVAMPLLPMASLVSRFGQYLQLGRSDMHVEVQPVDTQHYAIELDDVAGVHGAFMAGIIEHALRRKSQTAEVVHTPHDETRYRLDVRW